ncbi:MAG: cytochrome b [Caulobacter sp.]|nr:cytochrome b [Caulobacter sp.]
MTTETSGTDFTYARASVVLHWLMLLLMAAVYACIELRVLFERGSDLREGIKAWHFSLGLCMLALVIARIVIRVRAPQPPRPSGALAWLGAAMHVTLYALLLAMPVMGWVALSAAGDQIPLFGLQMPPLVAPNEALGERVEGLHERIGAIGYWLIGLHAAAALMHHYVLRDGTLRRMIPALGGAKV